MWYADVTERWRFAPTATFLMARRWKKKLTFDHLNGGVNDRWKQPAASNLALPCKQKHKRIKGTEEEPLSSIKWAFVSVGKRCFLFWALCAVRQRWKQSFNSSVRCVFGHEQRFLRASAGCTAWKGRGPQGRRPACRQRAEGAWRWQAGAVFTPNTFILYLCVTRRDFSRKKEACFHNNRPICVVQRGHCRPAASLQRRKRGDAPRRKPQTMRGLSVWGKVRASLVSGDPEAPNLLSELQIAACFQTKADHQTQN